jgi:hypothetical protein
LVGHSCERTPRQLRHPAVVLVTVESTSFDVLWNRQTVTEATKIGGPEILRLRSAALRIAARGSDATQTPQVKPRRADGTARESVWERRSSPA